jgi:hypothetical protein
LPPPCLPPLLGASSSLSLPEYSLSLPDM